MDKELYDKQKEEEFEEKEKIARKNKFKKYFKISLWTAGIVLILGGGGWYMAKSGFFTYDPLHICAQHTGVGMHIPPHLKIFVKSEEIKIPANLGISARCMRPIHTHDDTGTLHLEFPNRKDVLLEQFFKIWKKSLNDFGLNPKMKVNGSENSELQNYIMRDGDQIELFFD